MLAILLELRSEPQPSHANNLAKPTLELDSRPAPKDVEDAKLPIIKQLCWHTTRSEEGHERRPDVR